MNGSVYSIIVAHPTQLLSQPVRLPTPPPPALPPFLSLNNSSTLTSSPSSPQALPWLWVRSAALLDMGLPEAASVWLRGSDGSGGAGGRFELAQTVVFVLLLLVSEG